MKTRTAIALSPCLFALFAGLSGCNFHVINSQACVDWEPGICRERSDDMAIYDEAAEAFAADCDERGGELRELPGLCESNAAEGPPAPVGHCTYSQEDEYSTFVDAYAEPWTVDQARADCTGTWTEARTAGAE